MEIASNTTITIGLVISLFTVVVMFGRWQGRVDVKLDSIIESNKNLKYDITKLFEEVNKLHTRVSVLESRKRGQRIDTGE
jgi:hypothetical protein